MVSSLRWGASNSSVFRFVVTLREPLTPNVGSSVKFEPIPILTLSYYLKLLTLHSGLCNLKLVNEVNNNKSVQGTLPLLPMVEALLHDVQRPLDAGDGALQLPPRVVQLLARRH